MSGESREQRVQRQIDGDGLIGEWEERYGKKKKNRSVRKVRKRNRCAGKRIKRERKTVLESLSVRWIRSAKKRGKKEREDAGASEEEFTRRCKMIQDVTE